VVEVIRNDTLDGRAVHVVRLKQGTLPSRTYWVDAEHGDVLRQKQVALEGSIRVPVTIEYSGFEEHGGLRRPTRVSIENPMSGRIVLTLERFETGLVLDDEVFTLADPDEEQPVED
jgi:hypothetical protein